MAHGKSRPLRLVIAIEGRLQIFRSLVSYMDASSNMNEQSTSAYPNAPIASEKIVNDRKVFFLDLKENNRGRFLKITEDVGGRRDTIMLPAAAFSEFVEALSRLVEFESKLA